MKIQRFLDQHAQFFKTLAHPDVLSSILLEQPIGDLFTFLYGFNGQRAVKLFSFTAQVLLALPQDDMQASAQPATEVFEDSFLVLAKVIDLNGGAQIHPDIAAIVETFSAALTQLVGSQGGPACHKAQACLTRMQQRLGIGHAIPELTDKLKTPVKPVSFGIAIDPPGSLSPNGPRHDNDHQDIRHIKVLPTWQEVQSLRSEYLPAKESEDWHKQGIQGLLDRHFRLLREDTVGQLRDVIQTELGRMKNPGSHPNTRRDNRQGLRSHVYQGVRIEDLSVNRRDGLRLSGDDQSNSQKKPDARNLYTDVKSAFVTLKLGPPGTGKSYTGIALIKVLLDNRKEAKLGPILCVCYTNHALDQLLEHLVHAGISQIIRVGSRSKSEALEPLMLRNVARKMEGTKAEKRVAWELGSKLQSDESEIEDLITALSKADSWSSVKQYLANHYAHHHDQLFGSASMDENGFRLNRDPKKALSHWLRGDSVVRTGQPDRPVSILDRTALSEMSQGERQKLYWYWVQRIRGTTQRNLIQALHEYDRNRIQYQRNRMEMDLRCLQQAHIIGITTSGLARNLDILRRVRAKVMLCEEAGEVLESHTLTAMLPSVEHAILIGDHFQLRPQINRYDLGREHPRGEEYSLDVSLFERLVQPNDANAIQLPFTTLETQRRMHPMISQLVRDTLYPSLQDASSTSTYPMVAGMKKRLFWYDHTEFEANSDEAQGVVSTSHTNSFEIDMTIGLVSHLMKQGVYHADDIAVLTPYLGQLHLLRARLGRMWELVLNDRDLDQLEQAGMESDETPKVSKASALKALKVATIDNFQGEEAKVVIISLVRSNRMNKCGFLKTSNRINVLLSRAQHGMFIIGNSETAGSVKMWANVLGILRAGGNVGSAFELQLRPFMQATV
ncbi:nf-x1 finger and helicase domain protein [Neofusicoccum parvum]|uniref:Nf-x1 finger and helicase domain protein n=1 Tax=Neofusicoccum parvum TaxID=310453 RepID=A0ACB5SP44_9PEZI|nr:nf-x1 finger and helicase domain protein [Neofusicoccum parvum]